MNIGDVLQLVYMMDSYKKQDQYYAAANKENPSELRYYEGRITAYEECIGLVNRYLLNK